jgi:CubicO group peptidase (beta-lactamase class C family)
MAPPRASSAIASLMALLTLIVAASLARAQAPLSGVSVPALQAFFDEILTGQVAELRLPGAVIAVVHGGEIVVAAGYGYADLEAGVAMDAERSLVRTGSAGKPVTWAAVLQAAERGLVDLHADVRNYVDLDLASPFPEPITLAHLLTHTAGFEDVGERLFVLSPVELVGLGEYLRELEPARVFAPGAVQAYSNYGTALAGYAVERVTGTSFDEHVERELFEPLGMARSTLRQPVPSDFSPDLAVGYGFADGAFVRGGFEYVTPYPAGSMTTTATDMAALLIALLRGGELGGRPVLEPASMRLMDERQYAPDPRLPGVTFGLMERDRNGQRVLFHDGDTYLFSSGLYLVPDADLGFFVAYNGPDGPEARRALIDAFMDRFFPSEPLDPAPAGRTGAAGRYAGEYHLARAEWSGMGKVLRPFLAAQVRAGDAGELLVTFDGETLPFVELEPGLYRAASGGERLALFEDERGQAWMAFGGGPPFDAFNATTAFRAPWYATVPVLALTLGGSLILFVGSSVAWGLGSLVRRARRAGSAASPQRVARGVATLFGLLLLAFLVAFLGMLTDLHPAYGVPRVLLGDAPTLPLVKLLPWLLALAAVVLTVAVGTGLRRRAGGRRPNPAAPTLLHHGLLVVASWAVVACLAYWNLLTLAG